MSLKEQFIEEAEDLLAIQSLTVITVAVKLESGAIEVITNTQCLSEKAKYYHDSYDSEFRLKTNPKIQIVNFMLA